MDSTENQQEQQGQQEKGAHMNLMAQYLKDSNLEVPNSPKCFNRMCDEFFDLPAEEGQGSGLRAGVDITVDVQEDNNPGTDEGDAQYFEVVLSVRVHAKNGKEKTVYVLESHYACIVALSNFPDPDYVQRMLHVYVPQQFLLPNIRTVVRNIVLEAGFPSVLINPIDFEAVYDRKIKEQTGEEE